MKIPLHTIRTILDRLVRNKWVVKEKERYKIEEDCVEYLDVLKKEDDVQRRVNELLKDLIQFLNEQLNKFLDITQTRTLLLTFVHRNIEPVLEFLSRSGVLPDIECFESKIDREDERYLIEYIQIIKQRKSHEYKILKELILGSLISLVFRFDTPSKITEKFKRCQVFLDTNILFSLLGVHFKEFSEPAKELFELLKKYSFEIKVFDFTVNEATRVLNSCTRDRRPYPSEMKINSVCANLEK